MQAWLRAFGYGCMPPEIDLLGADRGSVTAPAGCGKTQLIANNLVAHAGSKPVLVLTHTNAGAAALRLRLQRAEVPSSNYRVATLDGFAMRLISWFPGRSGHDPRILLLDDRNNDYPAIRQAALALLEGRHITAALKATYSRAFVDEYQDCNLMQHAIVNALADALPTVVLGDPMQAIFNFRNNRLVQWRQDVLTAFPRLGRLQTPWRWINAGAEDLGHWLLQARDELRMGRPVDLRAAPPRVEWIQLDGADPDARRRAAAQTRLRADEANILIVGDSMQVGGRHQLTSQTPGATVVENVELTDLMSFARRLDLRADDALELVLDFAGEVMTGVGPRAFLERVRTIQQGRQRKPASEAEAKAVAFAAEPSLLGAVELLRALTEQPGTRTYRPDMLHSCRTAMREAAQSGCGFAEAALRVRERNRHMGRLVAKRAVGSTLLLKGLEADVAVILQPERMDASNLYVALTRGARRVLVCSQDGIHP